MDRILLKKETEDKTQCISYQVMREGKYKAVLMTIKQTNSNQPEHNCTVFKTSIIPNSIEKEAYDQAVEAVNEFVKGKIKSGYEISTGVIF